MPNVVPFILAFIYVLASLVFLFYFCVCLCRVYVCLSIDCVDVFEVITTDLTDRAKKRRRVHCFVIEYTPEAKEIESTESVPFTIAVPDALEIEED